MNDGWESDEDKTHCTLISSQTFGHGQDRVSGNGVGRQGGCMNRDRTIRSDGRDYGSRGRGGRGDRRGGGGSNSWRDSMTNSGGRGCEANRGRNTESYRGKNSEVHGGRHFGGTCIAVYSNDVGKVIGRGGCKIRELEEESGAHIQIGKKAEMYSQTTEIILTGSSEAQIKAKQLIEELLNNCNSRGGGNYSNVHGNRQGNSVHLKDPKENVSEDTGNSNCTPINWAEVNRIYEEAQKERWSKCPPLKKDFYVEDLEVTNMTPEEVSHFRKANNNIVVDHVFGGEKPIPNPVKTFEQCFSHYPEILEEIYKQDFKQPTPIQAQAWPVLLQGEDLIGIAQTGTGKTLAFLLPALIHIDNQPIARSQRGGPNVLIMAPTRELALQIEKEVQKYRYKDIKSVCVYGGGSRNQQMAAVTKGVEIIIATPGRLNDLVQAEIIDVTSITYLVLDEADRMLDMGFEPQIRKTLLDIRPDRQTVMTSATWPEGVRRLAQSYMSNPIQVFIGTLDLTAVHSVTQEVRMVNENSKNQELYDFITNMEPDDKVIVFVGKKIRADDIASELILGGILCQSIHGDREQCDREQALEDLKSGQVKILIATDVASRGIDIGDITHIFNYDFPRNIEEYVHRVGRTGRAGKSGVAISLVTRDDWAQAKELIAILKEANQEIPEELLTMAERFDAWKEKKANDKERERIDIRGCGRDGSGGGRGRAGRDRRTRW